MFSEDQKVAKQQYLRDHVMDAGYDVQEFLQFISNKKDQGTNIDLWELNELKQVVTEFCNFSKPVCITEQANQNEEEYDQEDGNESEEADLQFNNEILIQPGQQNSNEDYLDKFEKKFQKKFENNNPPIQQNQQVVQQDDIEDLTQNPDHQYQQQQQQEQGQQQSQENQNLTDEQLQQQMNQKQGQQEEFKENTAVKEFNQIMIKEYGLAEDPYEAEINCDKHLISIPIYSKIKITVTDPIKQQGGILGFSTFYTFKITTKPYNWEVRRKMKDFIAIRTILLKLFPAKIIPPLDIDNSEQSTQKINKRMKYMTSFINDLRQCPEMWSCQYVIDFLSMKDDSKFEKILKNSEKEREISKIKDMSNLSGKQKAVLNNSTFNYKEESVKFLNFSEAQYKKLHLLSKQLKKDFEKLSSTMSSIGIAYHELFGGFNDFDSKISEGKEHNSKLKESYVSFNNILMSWSKSMQQNSTQISDKLTHLFKYCNNEIMCFKELHKKSAEAEKTFCKYRSALLEKKEKLFKTDITRWEIDPKFKEEANHVKNNKNEAFKYMLARETTYEKYLKEQYAFWVQTENSELQRSFRKKAEDYIDFFKSFAKAETNIINELLGSWGSITQDYGFDNPFPVPKELVPGRLSINLQENTILNEPNIPTQI